MEEIGKYYPPEEKIHGFAHAKEVERLVLEISQGHEFSQLSLDLDVLSVAALFHDTGYSQKKEDWSVDQREHVRESMSIAQEVLGKISSFSEKPQKIAQVLYLISNHDNTNYLFPIKGRGGRPAITKEWVAEAERGWDGGNLRDGEFTAMLAILKEADSRLGTGTEGAQRTLKLNLNQGVPLFARGDPLRAWMWGESAVGSVRLAAKRALLDARTKKGKEIAWRSYLEAEALIKRECDRNGVSYQPELGLEELRLIKKEEISGFIEIIRVYPWEELEGILRQVKLKGDPTLFPYVTARIESQAFRIEEVYPLSLYVLSDSVQLHRELRELFLANYALDLLDLSGIIEFRTEEGEHLISPPLVEISKPDGDKPLLVDGINRFLLAREVGVPRVRSIVIAGVPDHFPLVPLPSRWDEVCVHETVPPEIEKRRFRFPDLDLFPDISWFSEVEVTGENSRYFFYRDLSPLGSSGIRKPGKEG